MDEKGNEMSCERSVTPGIYSSCIRPMGVAGTSLKPTKKMEILKMS